MRSTRILIVIIILLGAGMAAILFSSPMLPAVAEGAGLPAEAGSLLSASLPLTNTVYFPLTFSSPGGLYGRVTQGGSPAANVEISLVLFYVRPPLPMTVMTTTTQANGLYQFLDVPTITSCTDSPYCMQDYYITYQNQGSDPQRIDSWKSQRLPNYTQGTAFNLSNFDLAAPQFLTPADGEHVTSPVHFSWQPRPIDDNDYLLFITANNQALSYWTGSLGYTGEYDLDIEKEVCSVVTDSVARPLARDRAELLCR